MNLRSILQARAHFETAGKSARQQLDPSGEAEAIIGAAAATSELGEPAIAVAMLHQANTHSSSSDSRHWQLYPFWPWGPCSGSAVVLKRNKFQTGPINHPGNRRLAC